MSRICPEHLDAETSDCPWGAADVHLREEPDEEEDEDEKDDTDTDNDNEGDDDEGYSE